VFYSSPFYFQYGWYWGPISSEAAEKILSTEPDGSFIVRDSSDDHYIFSLTFKLNACVRHVRIEHYQGKSLVIVSIMSQKFLPCIMLLNP
jgi:SH2 domain.